MAMKMSSPGRALGKLAVRHDPRSFKLSTYLDVRAYRAPPPARDWVDHSHRFDVLANDTIGDCAFAAQAHMHQCFAAQHDKTCYISTSEVLAAYSEVTGYTPLDPSTDRGTVLIDALNHWRKVGIGGHKIGAYFKVELGNQLEIEAAMNLGCGVYVGAMLPRAAQKQTVWDIAAPENYDASYIPGSWGGHAMACPAYSRSGLVLVTWGKLKTATWEWLYTYADEIYAVLSDDWVSGNMPAPNGLDLEALRNDLAKL